LALRSREVGADQPPCSAARETARRPLQSATPRQTIKHTDMNAAETHVAPQRHARRMSGVSAWSIREGKAAHARTPTCVFELSLRPSYSLSSFERCQLS
jgi:hypothetical protein